MAVGVTGPSTRSVALTENETTAPCGWRLGILFLRTVMFDGTVITGGVVSSTSKKLSGAVPVPPAPVLLMTRTPVALPLLLLPWVAIGWISARGGLIVLV